MADTEIPHGAGEIPDSGDNGGNAGTETTVFDKPISGLQDTLLEQFYYTLGSRFQAAVLETDMNAPLTQEVRKLLNDTERTWRTAYLIEQKLVYLLNPAQLKTELLRRYAEAKDKLPEKFLPTGKEIDAIIGEIENVPDNTEETSEDSNPAIHEDSSTAEEPTPGAENGTNKTANARAVLHRLLDDLQWQAQKTEDAANKQKQATEIISGMAMVTFAITVFIVYCGKDFTLCGDQCGNIVLSVFSGLLGAQMALAIRINKSYGGEDLRLVQYCSEFSYLLMRSLIGGMAAFVGYCLLSLGFLAALTSGGAAATQTPPQASLVVIWGVVFGFSEVLLPNALAKVEKKVKV